MKWLKRKGDSTSNSYWDTISDVMTSLLLTLLLVTVLLVLYVVRAPEYSKQDSQPESEIVNDGDTVQYVDRDTGHEVIKTDVPYWYQSAEDDEYGQGEYTGDYLYVDGGFDEGQFDGHAGSAVQVIAVDSETHKAIPVEGVKFKLYSSEGRRITLYTYYPEKTTWRTFATTGAGSFIMPEKLPLSAYMLREMTAPSGYAMSGDVTFSIEEPHSMKDPYIVRVELEPHKNSIHLKAVDSLTGEPVPGCTYNITAAEDILTNDGTLRYAEGVMVDQVICDEKGEGSSIAVYLGNYVIQQSSAPDFYSVSSMKYPLAVDSNETSGKQVEQKVICERTRFTISVVDELYHNIGIPDAEFTFRAENGEPVQLSTDENGKILLNELNKNTLYSLTETATADGYQLNDSEITFFVDENGMISGAPDKAELLTNRTLRFSVDIQDTIFKNAVSGCRVSLYDGAHQLLKTWYSSDRPVVIQGYPEGQYSIEISGAGASSKIFNLEDTAGVQNIQCIVFTKSNMIFAGGCAGFFVLTAAALTVIAIRRKKRRK